MRRVLAAMAAASFVLPAGSAAAVDPLCETLGNVYPRFGCGWHPLDELDATTTTSAFALSCTVTGALPGTSESGTGQCSGPGAMTSTRPYSAAGGGDATLRFGSTGAASLASSSGWFTLSWPLLRLTARGTYTRAGSTWVFTGTQYDTLYGPSYEGPFAAVGEGAPLNQGYPLVLAGV